MSDWMEIDLGDTRCRQTLQAQKPCPYCKSMIPAQAVGNPQWPWKTRSGRGLVVLCGDNCHRWFIYRRAQAKLIGIMKAKHYSEDEITDRLDRMEQEWRDAGNYPVQPDPVSDHTEDASYVILTKRKRQFGITIAEPKTVKTRLSIDKYRGGKDMITESTAVQAAETPETPAVPQTDNNPTQPAEPTTEGHSVPVSIPPALLKKTIRVMSLEGNCISAMVSTVGNEKRLQIREINQNCTQALADELRELSWAVMEVIANG